jgi:hypothetical protein
VQIEDMSAKAKGFSAYILIKVQKPVSYQMRGVKRRKNF